MSGLQWLRSFAESTLQVQWHPVADSAEILMHQLISLLRSPSLDESSLIDLVGMEMIHMLPDLLDRKDDILREWNFALAGGPSTGLQTAPLSQDMGQTLSQIRLVKQSEMSRTKQAKKFAEKQKRIVENTNSWITGYDDELALLTQLGRTPPPLSVRAIQESLGVGGPKVVLPEGTSRHIFETYEEYRIPASGGSQGLDQSSLIPVTRLPPWAQPAFTDSPFLNRIQSKVFPVAFGKNDNFLMCAPTGAGKTNVALLAICRLIAEYRAQNRSDFKVVYLAPMKALVSEIVEKFSKKLSGKLSVSVREFTADMSIPRKELEAVNVIVTVPEKWDILLRNLGKVSAANVPGEEAHSLQAQLKIQFF